MTPPEKEMARMTRFESVKTANRPGYRVSESGQPGKKKGSQTSNSNSVFEGRLTARFGPGREEKL